MNYQITKEKKLESKYDSKDLFLDGYDYNVWSENKEESTDKEASEDQPPMPSLKGDEEK